MATSAVLVNSNLKSLRLYKAAIQIVVASMLIALCAQIRIPLFFSPVPLSGQTFAIMLIGATLGSRKGLLSVILYLIEGSCGLPVFAGGSFGLAALLGTNGGYFVGFMLQAYLVGWCIERQQAASAVKTMGVLLLSCTLQLGLGALWLSQFVGLENAAFMGVTPFIIGEICKAIGITSYLKLSLRCKKY